MLKIDGNQSLADQQSAIRAYEAAGSALQGLWPVMDGSHDNGASFQNLAPGNHPSQINLTTGVIPATTTLVCVATIFIAGTLTKISAYR
jgi:hypothetical protein